MGRGEEGGGLGLLLLATTLSAGRRFALVPASGVGKVHVAEGLVVEETWAVPRGEEAAGRQASQGWASTLPLELGGSARLEGRLLALAACLLLSLPPSPPLLLLSLVGLALALAADLEGLRLDLGGVRSLLSLLSPAGWVTTSSSLPDDLPLEDLELLPMAGELLQWGGLGLLLLGACGLLLLSLGGGLHLSLGRLLSSPLQEEVLLPSGSAPLQEDLLLPSTLPQVLLLPDITWEVD